MLLEEQRYLHEDLERLEEAIAERVSEEPKLVSTSKQMIRIEQDTKSVQLHERLNRDHEIAQLLDQVQKQSANLLAIYRDTDGSRAREMQQMGTGDPFEEFYKQLRDIREYHTKYPNEQAENPETRYKARRPGPGDEYRLPTLVDSMFSGEEAFGRFFDLHMCHEAFLNLPNVKRLSYLQYLEQFDNFASGAGGIKRSEKMTDQYFQYLGELSDYLESFMRRTRPLEDLDKLFRTFDEEFAAAWEKDAVTGWEKETPAAAATAANGSAKTASSPEAVWCADCEKEFKNENVYKSHLSGRKHIKAAEARAAAAKQTDAQVDTAALAQARLTHRLKERAIAAREDRIKRLAKAMEKERADTRVNVERKQGMTERERQQELENLFAEQEGGAGAGGKKAGQKGKKGAGGDDGEDGDGDDKLYNPLRLPLAWDGKPIPFWLYRLHGLGVEFPCEICGNFVYMGRRAYEKHFNEGRHIYGLKCLGITSTGLFRDIDKIEEALKLWDKIQRNRKRQKVDESSIVQMEDAEGNVMPEKVYYDLQKQGLL